MSSNLLKWLIIIFVNEGGAFKTITNLKLKELLKYQCMFETLKMPKYVKKFLCCSNFLNSQTHYKQNLKIEIRVTDYVQQAI